MALKAGVCIRKIFKLKNRPGLEKGVSACLRVRRKGKDRTMRFDAKEFGGRISIIMDENVWNKMKDTGA